MVRERTPKVSSNEREFDAGDWISARSIPAQGKMPLLSALLGVLVGAVGVSFFAFSELLRNFLFGSVGGLVEGTDEGLESRGWFGTLNSLLPDPDPANPRVWLLALIPALGGLLVGLWFKATRDTTHNGTEAAIASFHNERGRFQPGNVWKKFVASCITLGTGGAAGREGPIALMGASLGSGLANRFGLTQRERRILLVAGLAAGIGGMFRAPLAGGLMAAEILYSDAEFEPDVLIPSTIASIMSYCVFCLNFGWGSLFGKVAADYQFSNPLELIPLTGLAVAITIAGFVYVATNRLVARLFKGVPRLIRPAIGAGGAGVIAILLYLISGPFSADGEPQKILFAVMGDGYSALDVAFSGRGLWWLFLMVAGGKILASALTVGSGGAGGYFAPSMVIGGCVGAGVGILFFQALPVDILPGGLVPTEDSALAAVIAVFALVGMAGFWTGTAKVPIGSVIIVSELTGSYHVLLPALWTCAIVFVLSRGFKLYKTQVATRRDSPAHVGDFAANVLKEIRVSEVLGDLTGYDTIDEGTSLQQILSMKSSRQAYYPVVDRDGRFTGIFSLNDVRAVLDSSEVWQLLVAADIARRNVMTVHPSDTLADVANKFETTNYDELPVVGDTDESRLLGIISRRQLNNAYIRRVMHYDQAAKAELAAGHPSERLPKVRK
ncbi:MAG: chloride channel protein [Planctomycetes bacterium]|nr:chloride channel protein [Planctomycetota bacterium]